MGRRMALSGVWWSTAGTYITVTAVCPVGHLDALLSDHASEIGLYVYVNICLYAHTFMCTQI